MAPNTGKRGGRESNRAMTLKRGYTPVLRIIQRWRKTPYWRRARRPAAERGSVQQQLSRVNRQRGRRACAAPNPAQALLSACFLRRGSAFALTAAPSAPARNVPALQICLRSRFSPVHHPADSVRAMARAEQALRASRLFGACPSVRCPPLALPVQTISLPVRRAMGPNDIGCARRVQTHRPAIFGALSGTAGRYSAHEVGCTEALRDALPVLEMFGARMRRAMRAGNASCTHLTRSASLRYVV